jgi:hypothetical protein
MRLPPSGMSVVHGFAPIRAGLKALSSKAFAGRNTPNLADRFGENTKGGCAAGARPCGASARRGARRLLRPHLTPLPVVHPPAVDKSVVPTTRAGTTPARWPGCRTCPPLPDVGPPAGAAARPSLRHTPHTLNHNPPEAPEGCNRVLEPPAQAPPPLQSQLLNGGSPRPIRAHARRRSITAPGAVTSARKRAFQPPPGAWIKDRKIIDKGEIDGPCWARVCGGGSPHSWCGGVTAPAMRWVCVIFTQTCLKCM